MKKEIHKVLVCGGRDFKDEEFVFQVLDNFHKEYPIDLVVQGYANGADKLADKWARERGVNSTGRKYEITKEMWKVQGKSAGYRRNVRMAENEKPSIVIAFPGGPGTKMMIKVAKHQKIKVLKFEPG